MTGTPADIVRSEDGADTERGNPERRMLEELHSALRTSISPAMTVFFQPIRKVLAG
jgi:hypothetical protein